MYVMKIMEFLTPGLVIEVSRCSNPIMKIKYMNIYKYTAHILMDIEKASSEKLIMSTMLKIIKI